MRNSAFKILVLFNVHGCFFFMCVYEFTKCVTASIGKGH